MGTLFNQQPRQESVMTYYRWLDNELFRHDTHPLKWEQRIQLMELAIKMQNGDVRDEQLAGLGEILKEIADALRESR